MHILSLISRICVIQNYYLKGKSDMILKNTDIRNFNNLMENREIICFGSGKQLNVFFKYCTLADNVKCIIDNDINKWHTIKKISNQQKEILSPETLPSLINKNTIILITAGIMGLEIFDQLSEMKIPSEQEVFWSIFVLSELESWKILYKDSSLPSNLKQTSKPLIPKIIHYCWVGDNPIPQQHKKYIDGWKRLCHDYEFKLWNEKNYDIEKNQYMKQAYEAKKWGFVPDYIRKDVIYEYGGIYLDTDVELIKNLDDLLYQDGFCGVENGKNDDYRVNFGLGYGARKGLPIIKELRDVYNDENFKFEKNIKLMKIGPSYETEILKKYGFSNNGKYQIIEGLTIYPSIILGETYFNISNVSDISKNTYAIHHHAGSWVSEEYMNLFQRFRQLYQSCITI